MLSPGASHQTQTRHLYACGVPVGSDPPARRRETANPQGMLSRRTSARPRTRGVALAAPKPTHAAEATPRVGASGLHKPRLSCQACRLAATTIVVPSTTAAPALRTHAVAAGVRPSWAWSTRLTIAAPIAATAAVSGRWPNIHCRLAAGSGLVGRCPAKSKYVHQAPKPTTTATSPTLTVSALTR